MEHDLYSLAYLSRSNADRDGSDLEAVIQDILAAAHKTNSRLGVTGALLVSHGYFAQVLEGTQASVETVFQSIQCDARHRDAKVLYFKPLEKRDFANWSMAFAGSWDQGITPPGVDVRLADQESMAASRIGQDLVKVLKGLIERQELTAARL